jgi:hypothetical protein
MTVARARADCHDSGVTVGDSVTVNRTHNAAPWLTSETSRTDIGKNETSNLITTRSRTRFSTRLSKTQ